MSASYALIKFEKTGNIYHGCYEGTSDSMRPHICTPEECYNKETDCYCSISYCRELGKTKSWTIPDDVPDLDECEVYSDYGSGFYWSTVGSESLKMISCPMDEFGEIELREETDGQPEWVKQYWKEIGAEDE